MTGEGLSSIILTLVTFIPLAGAALLLFVPNRERDIRVFSLVISLLAFVLSLHLPVHLQRAQAGFQYEVNIPWIPTPNIHYHMGVDGISMWLLVLTTFLTPLCVLISWKSIHERVKEFFILLLILETALIGVFVSLDLFLFYFFWEATLIPMALLIGMFGHGRRVYAAVKFFLYTMIASAFMLAAILWFYAKTGSFDFTTIQNLARTGNIEGFTLAAPWLFLGFFIAFAVKVPLFPFHTWLPDAHVEAPTAGSVLLAGVLLKMGTYGFLRFCLPLFPDASLAFGPLIFALAVIGIVYGAWVSTVQPDLKRLVAYSSVSHLGFVMLGIFTLNTQGLVGGLIQMVNHGLSTGALFLLVGMIYERRHTRLIADFGGLWKVVPAFSAVLLLVSLSSLGLPGLNGFVGEFLILVGVFQVNRLLAAAATTGIIFAAVYLLWMYQRVIFGEVTREENRRLPDLTPREWAVMAPVIVFIVWIGVYPAAFTGPTEATIDALIAQVESKASVAAEPVRTSRR